ncbi:hypothetical protein [Variovorax guangxiensis]|uniref:Uncharacterized protein n=1 Tax=Variovorax guangxiensis TaxID=1775474 RepID=A0A840G0T1_9BURK|nr:hypothetical protein [Variovorax guangxiensis]MBB4224907.1 hypothetical protein [Variovorax guangxiensis]
MQRACDLASQARCAFRRAARAVATAAAFASRCCLAFIRWPHTDLLRTTMTPGLLAHQQSTRSLLPAEHARAPQFRSKWLIHKGKGSGTAFAYIEHAAN